LTDLLDVCVDICEWIWILIWPKTVVPVSDDWEDDDDEIIDEDGNVSGRIVSWCGGMGASPSLASRLTPLGSCAPTLTSSHNSARAILRLIYTSSAAPPAAAL
jgi:hypothetical protein